MGIEDSSDRMYTTYDWDYDGAWNSMPSATKASASASASGAEDRVAPVAGEEKAVQEHVHRLVNVAGVSKESASELFVAEKTLPMFATGSEYQKRYSVPAAHRQRAVASAMKVQKAARDCLTKVTAPSKRGATGLAAPHYPATVQNTIPRTTYQSAFGSKRMVGLPVRIRMLAAKQK